MAKDIAKVLGYTRTRDMLRICYDYEIKQIAATIVGALSARANNQGNYGNSEPRSPSELGSGRGGARTFTLISEPGVYHILYATKHPLTRDFQEWTYNQVMPSIRATGSYMDDDIRELIRSRPDLIDEYLLDQKAAETMWEAERQIDEEWTANMLRTEYIFDNPYGKPID